eukprot:TRINITY_DN17387_c0_g1_i1.p1 TRINITY_DN17387_c0_g1~~TRINITY_DN17387_c0_g1_i1.p1  ORF type:complete len:628 (-),score=103.07 TRINITY_DN17387_c0_g1_i1:249-1964(-)
MGAGASADKLNEFIEASSPGSLSMVFSDLPVDAKEKLQVALAKQSELQTDAWEAALAKLCLAIGLDDSLAISFKVPGSMPTVPSVVPVGAAAATSFAALARAIAALSKSRGSTVPPSVTISMEAAERALAGCMFGTCGGNGLIPDLIATLQSKGEMDILNYLGKFDQTSDGRWLGWNVSEMSQMLGGVSKKLDETLGASGDAATRNAARVKAVAAKTAEEMEEEGNRLGACVQLVRTKDEWLAHPVGAMLAKLPPVETEKIGAGPPVVLPPVADGCGPLDGIKVIDLTRVIAGPSGVRLLADYGAEVLRVTSSTVHDYPFMFKCENIGKVQCELNLKDEADRAKLMELAADADVIVDSNRAGSLEKLGISAAALAASREGKSGFVFASFTCFGVDGPWKERGGFDLNAQITTGMVHMHQDGAEGEPGFMPNGAPNDYTGGCLLATGIVAALARRGTDGGSYHVRTSLCQASQWTMSEFPRMPTPPPKPPVGEDKLKAMQEEKAKNDIIYAPFLTTVRSDFGDVVAPHLNPSKIINGIGIFARQWRRLEYGFKPGAHEAKWGQTPPIPSESS